MSVSDIANEMGVSRPTVRKYMKVKKPPAYGKENGTSGLEPCKAYIKDRTDRHNLTAARILEEIRKKGYAGGYTILKDYCRTVRRDREITAMIRFETEPGKQVRAGFGEFGHIAMDGERKKPYML